MDNVGSTIFLQLSRDDERLEPVVVTDVGVSGITVRFENREAEIAPGLEVAVLRNVDGAFTRQIARINAIISESPLPPGRPLIAGLSLCGQTKPAEKRSCFRVSTAAAKLTACIDEEADCSLLDVSIAGFAAVSHHPHAVGESVEVTLDYEGRSYRGRATVQNVRRVGPDRVRYGLHCTIDHRHEASLAQGLRQMATGIQRQQLKRRSRRAE